MTKPLKSSTIWHISPNIRWHVFSYSSPKNWVSKLNMRIALFWAIMQRVAVIPYWCFSTTYQSHLQGSRIQASWPLKMGLAGRPEMSVRNYHHSPHNNPEKRSSHLLRGRSLKSRRVTHVLYRCFPQHWGLWRGFVLYSSSSDIQLIW